ncbi:PEP-CTERM sorting domain-containing protein [Ottowia sp.]|uniref:PEP-CTERM sorting domain-containing protein n=1 Tax=Ottowia sp. TaxID=1898956 RepID=UPI0025CF8383|nr:PEP-CTERM sorting domain-containing protein [Ottowia sp.]
MGTHALMRAARRLLPLALGGVVLGASGAFLNAPVPANAYITQGGLDWAWASPLPAAVAPLDLSYQSAQGWRLPTAAELANAPLATDFMKAGANVPLAGTDPVSGAYFAVPNANLTGPAACATPYFSASYHHCDWADGLGQPDGPWAQPGDVSRRDQLVVRTSGAASAIAPVPTLGGGALVLLSLTLLGVGWLNRPRQR